MYANDTTLININSSKFILANELETNLNHMREWFGANSLHMISNKTHSINFYNNYQRSVKVDGSYLIKINNSRAHSFLV